MMDNEKFQELVLKKLEDVDNKLNSLDKRQDAFDNRQDGFDNKLEALNNSQSNTECDIKTILEILEKNSEKLDRIGGIVVRMENDNTTNVRALFERYDIHDNELNDHDARPKVLERK